MSHSNTFPMIETDTYPMLESRLPDPQTDPQFYDGVLAKRAVAWVLDAVAIGLLTGFVTLFVGIGTLGLGFLLAPVIILATGFLYRFFTIAAYSRTPGMAMLGIEFRNVAGQRFDRTEAFVHTALFTFIFASVVGQFLTCLCAMFTARRQTIADVITGSTAINRPL